MPCRALMLSLVRTVFVVFTLCMLRAVVADFASSALVRQHGMETEQSNPPENAKKAEQPAEGWHPALLSKEQAGSRATNTDAKPELVLQTGEREGITGIAVSPDGRYLVTNSYSALKLWDTATGLQLRSWVNLNPYADSVAFSPDGHLLASESWDGIKLWDVDTGRELRRLEDIVKPDFAGLPKPVAFSPDGRLLASTAVKVAALWDVATGALVHKLPGHSGVILAVAFSPDGRSLATGSADNTVRLWEVGRGRELRVFEGHDDVVTAVAFSPDGRWIASGSCGGSIKLWDVGRGGEIATLAGHKGRIAALAFDPKGHWLASGADDNTVKLWSLDSKREIRTLSGYYAHRYDVPGSGVPAWAEKLKFAVGSLIPSPDGQKLAVTTAEGIALWEAGTGREVLRLNRNVLEVSDLLAFSPDGRKLLSATSPTLGVGDTNNVIVVWDLEAGRQRHHDARTRQPSAGILRV